MEKVKLEKEIAKYESWREKIVQSTPQFNISGTKRPVHPIYDRDDLTSQEKDTIMLAYDWKQVGNDMRKYLS